MKYMFLDQWLIECLESRARRTEDGIEILPAATFVRRLWKGELIQPGDG